MGINRLITAGTLLAALAGCTGDVTEAPASTSNQCQGSGPNLLQDPEFTTLDAPRRERKWFSSQHGSEPSFEHSATNGELSITKTGSEPWFLLAQIIEGDDIPGRRVVFKAEIKLDMHPPAATHGFKQGGGLSVTAWNNGKLVLTSQLEHEPHMGTSDWQPVQRVLTLPERTQSARFGFIHQAGGSIGIRKPSLQQAVGDDCSG